MNETNTYHKDITLCFNLNDIGLRKFLSIKERKNGDLIIMPKYAEFFRRAQEKADNIVKIKQQKYSIHLSPNSKEFNVCMHNLELSDGKIIRTPHYTKTIKSNNGKLTPLFFCRSPDLSIDKYQLNSKDENNIHNLGNFDSKANTLYYGVFICSTTVKSFLSFKTGEQNYKIFKFLNFTLLIVWSFQYIPSHFSGAKIHFRSLDDQTLNDEIGSNIFKTTEGSRGLEAKQLLSYQFNELKKELLSTLIQGGEMSSSDTLFELPFSKTPYKLKIKGK